jgi:hypothetical protein
MHKLVIRLLLAQILLASVAMADPGSLASPSPKAAPAPVCDAASSLWAGDPMTGAVFLAPPNGCSSICSAANGQSCSPVGKIKSCYDVSNPDGCGACTCTASLVWSCDPGSI